MKIDKIPPVGGDFTLRTDGDEGAYTIVGLMIGGYCIVQNQKPRHPLDVHDDKPEFSW